MVTGSTSEIFKPKIYLAHKELQGVKEAHCAEKRKLLKLRKTIKLVTSDDYEQNDSLAANSVGMAKPQAGSGYCTDRTLVGCNRFRSGFGLSFNPGTRILYFLIFFNPCIYFLFFGNFINFKFISIRFDIKK